MPETMTKSNIFESVQVMLAEALGTDEEEITPEASLTRDLGAESIDFLDIVFRLEKKFSTSDRPFKIEQGELFPDNLMENPEWVREGKLTDAGMTMLRERMPHVDFEQFDQDRDANKASEVFTVQSIVDFVERKLAT